MARFAAEAGVSRQGILDVRRLTWTQALEPPLGTHETCQPGALTGVAVADPLGAT